MQELVLQGHKQKLYKTCSRYEKDTWHVEYKHLLQPPNDLIITIDRFNYVNDIITKNRSPIPLDPDTIPCLYKFSLQANVDYHRNFIHCGHYTASVNWNEKHSIVMIIHFSSKVMAFFCLIFENFPIGGMFLIFEII